MQGFGFGQWDCEKWWTSIIISQSKRNCFLNSQKCLERCKSVHSFLMEEYWFKMVYMLIQFRTDQETAKKLINIGQLWGNLFQEQMIRALLLE